MLLDSPEEMDEEKDEAVVVPDDTDDDITDGVVLVVGS